MSTNNLQMIRHRLKGTLQQLDNAFAVLEDLITSDPMEAEELRNELIQSLERNSNALLQINIPSSSHDLCYPKEDSISSWTKFFHDRAESLEIFAQVKNSQFFRTKVSATTVGNMWLDFSEIMPKVLCLFAGNLSNNVARTRMVKIAWEELGLGNTNEIHALQFKECLQLACVEIIPIQSRAINELNFNFSKATFSDAFIFGYGLGLEIIAVENIETLFESMAYNPSIKRYLEETPFFLIHRQNEVEHIRHCVESFLRYCNNRSDRNDFIKGFDRALHFWKKFWKEATQEMEDKQLIRVRS